MELKTTLNEKMAKRYELVKETTGMVNDKEVLAFLISKEYRRIQKAKRRTIFIPKETYEQAEEIARARGQTVDEYIGKLAEALLKEAKEGLKHGN